MDKLEPKGFEKRDEIEKLGYEALTLINDFEPSHFLDNSILNSGAKVKALEHTLGKEVRLLVKLRDDVSKR